jgi:transposase-like protein
MCKRKNPKELFMGHHFDREAIVLCVRWYLRYKFSLRDLVETMAERGLSLSHTTIMRWVKRFTPGFVKRSNRFTISAERSWRVDETYLKIRGKWGHLTGRWIGPAKRWIHAAYRRRRPGVRKYNAPGTKPASSAPITNCNT